MVIQRESYDFLAALQKFPSLAPTSYQNLRLGFHHFFSFLPFFGFIFYIFLAVDVAHLDLYFASCWNSDHASPRCHAFEKPVGFPL
jgi:hypothetical protein